MFGQKIDNKMHVNCWWLCKSFQSLWLLHMTALPAGSQFIAGWTAEVRTMNAIVSVRVTESSSYSINVTGQVLGSSLGPLLPRNEPV